MDLHFLSGRDIKRNGERREWCEWGGVGEVVWEGWCGRNDEGGVRVGWCRSGGGSGWLGEVVWGGDVEEMMSVM